MDGNNMNNNYNNTLPDPNGNGYYQVRDYGPPAQYDDRFYISPDMGRGGLITLIGVGAGFIAYKGYKYFKKRRETMQWMMFNNPFYNPNMNGMNGMNGQAPVPPNMPNMPYYNMPNMPYYNMPNMNGMNGQPMNNGGMYDSMNAQKTSDDYAKQLNNIQSANQNNQTK